jgi:hypothetical protein
MTAAPDACADDPRRRRPAPARMRDVFALFRFYRDATGLDGLIGDLDLTGVLPRQVYHAVHGRPPESIETAMADGRHDIADILAAALRSSEFRRNFARNVLSAFPDRRRRLFIHIPHCPGAALSARLSLRNAALNTDILDERRISEAGFFRAVKDVVLEIEMSQTVYVHGATPLRALESWQAPRFEDEIFTILRDPVERAVAHVNTILERLFSADAAASPEILHWRRILDVATPRDPSPSLTELQRMAASIVTDRETFPFAPMVGFLGEGGHDQAAEAIVTRDVEVTDAARHAAWARARWDVAALEEDAAPPARLSFETLGAAAQAVLRDLLAEDQRLYRWVEARLTETGRLSLRGRELLPLPAPPAPSHPVALRAVPPHGEEEAPLPPASEHPPEPPRDPDAERALMLRFESLGENCEFGLVQRRCGAEPLGLLRFSSSPLPKLLAALRARFDGMGAPENLEIQLSANSREYMVLDRRFGFLYHAWVNVGELTPEQIHAREVLRVPFLVRKLIEDLEAGEKIFVFHGMNKLTMRQAYSLWKVVRHYGSGKLLWVERATRGHEPGSVEQLEDGLYKAYVDRFAPGENAHDLSLACWIALCEAAVASADDPPP